MGFGQRHEVEYWLSVAATLGATTEDTHLELVIRPQATGAAQEGDSSPAQMKKRETSKISLDAAVPSEDVPKTIRLKPVSGGAAKIPKPGIITQSPAVQASPVSEKRQTSRISLEAALAPEAGPSGETPKTIRLKGKLPIATAGEDVRSINPKLFPKPKK